MAEVIAIAGIVVPAVVAFVAPAFVEFVKKKMNERKESVADIHEVLEKGLKELLAFQKDRSKLYKLSKTQVSDIEKTVTSLDKKYKQVRETKWRKRQRLAAVREEIKRALDEVIGLLGKCKDMNVERVIKENGVPSIKNYQTLQEAFQAIQDLLQKDRVKCVSLHGRKGMGKTTIMQHLNNHFLDRADFDMVIFIKVAADEQTKDLHILQKIADRMKADREGNESEVAGRILKVLEDKRYLLILDGVSHTIDGIWKNLDISKDEKDSKVVIATHYHLAWKSACVQRDVKLKNFTPTDAWKMFRDIVGDNLLPDIKSEARRVCQKFCCCLPLLIYPIAWSFKNGAPIDWGTPFPQDGVDGVKEIYSILEICYKRLGDESKQKCFLYASLYPANSNICTHHLVECCIVQGFLGVHANTTYRKMRRRAKDVILKHLVDVAFLEEGEQMSYVKMTDLYRQLALYISTKDPNSECRIYVDNEEDEEDLRSKAWRDAKWVSMVDSKRNSLPTNPDYGSLRTLLLQKNMQLVEIPTTYFDSMGNLLVLNLNGTKIRRLPSLLGLTNLKALYLNDCLDFDMSQSYIQRLQHLEVFDSRGTRVDLDFVPYLENLRYLRISYITIDIQGISKLHKLEELTIEGCNKMSNVNAINNTPENAGIHLEQLNSNNSQQGIIYFKGPLHRGSFSTLHTLTLKNSIIVFYVAVDVFPELQNLIVQNCSRIEVLIKVTEGGESIVSKLKMLTLDNLSDTKFICSNENLAWSSLEKLRVRKCPQLRRLPFNKTKATNLSTIEGEEEWWSNLVWTGEDREQLQSAFSAFT